MKAVPIAFFGMGAVMYGVNWIIRRRIDLKKDQSEDENHG